MASNARQVLLVKSSEAPWWAFVAMGFGAYLLLRSGQADREEREGQQRASFAALYDNDVSPSNPAFRDATPARLAKVKDRLPALGRMAVEIQQARGTFNDDEGAVYGALAGVRSLYELLWLNKTFSYLFDRPAVAPTLGAYMDGFLSDREWSRIVARLKTLPKYNP